MNYGKVLDKYSLRSELFFNIQELILNSITRFHLLLQNYRRECMFKEYNRRKKRSANYLSVVRDNRRWNSNLTGISNGKFRTLRFYGRKLEPGEEKVVMYPYEICSIWFIKKTRKK